MYTSRVTNTPWNVCLGRLLERRTVVVVIYVVGLSFVVYLVPRVQNTRDPFI